MRSFFQYGLVTFLLQALLIAPGYAQETSQYQYWLEIASADQRFVQRSEEIGRTQAFLEFLGEGSVVFRQGPVDALAVYSSEAFQNTVDELRWKAHYIDVSRAGDLGLSAGPITVIDASGEESQNNFGHLVSIWRKLADGWRVMADLRVPIPGYLSLEVEPRFEDTLPVLEETAHPVMAMNPDSSLQSLIEMDNLFGRNINFRGGERALLRYGMENARVYLPGMGPAVGVETASSVYGAFLDDWLSNTATLSLSFVGGYLSESKEMGYTYGTISSLSENSEPGFRMSYVRLWRYHQSNEWRIAVEVLRPY